MRTYKIVLHLWEHATTVPHLQTFEPLRVALYVRAFSRRAALDQIHTVYVSADLSKVTLNGGVGHDGMWYPEWEVVTIRTLPQGTPVRENYVVT